MTDRELLELAAKASGIRALFDPHGALRNCSGNDPAMNIFASPMWNPLTDDGDALRLAVKLVPFGLGFDVRIWPDRTAVVWDRTSPIARPIVIEHNADNTSPFTATRRAIVRAAAEIGKAMP